MQTAFSTQGGVLALSPRTPAWAISSALLSAVSRCCPCTATQTERSPVLQEGTSPLGEGGGRRELGGGQREGTSCEGSHESEGPRTMGQVLPLVGIRMETDWGLHVPDSNPGPAAYWAVITATFLPLSGPRGPTQRGSCHTGPWWPGRAEVPSPLFPHPLLLSPPLSRRWGSRDAEEWLRLESLCSPLLYPGQGLRLSSQHPVKAWCPLAVPHKFYEPGVSLDGTGMRVWALRKSPEHDSHSLVIRVGRRTGSHHLGLHWVPNRV